jgi:large-conductance mechanosensitive channel
MMAVLLWIAAISTAINQAVKPIIAVINSVLDAALKIKQIKQTPSQTNPSDDKTFPTAPTNSPKITIAWGLWRLVCIAISFFMAALLVYTATPLD